MNFPEIEAESVAKQFVHQTLSNCDLNELNPLPLCNVGLIQAQLPKLKRKRAPGLDNICTEHLIYSHPLISVHISMLFNVCLTHGFIPNRCIASVITSVVKSNKNSVRDVNNYRPQSWTALFRAFSSHRQPSAIFSKVLPAEQTSWPNWQTLLACSAGSTFEKIAEGCR